MCVFKRGVLGLLLGLLLVACGGTKKATQVIHVELEDSHYKKLPKNINRLVDLMKGVYVMQRPIKGEKDRYTNFVLNEEKDSMLCVYKPVGVPSKDGYWFLVYHFTTALPNQPLKRSMIELKPTNERDTILMNLYELKADIIIDDFVGDEKALYNKIDWKQVHNKKLNTIPLTYINATRFEGKAAKFAKVREDIRQKGNWKIVPNGTQLTIQSFKGESAELIKSSILWMDRRNIDLMQFTSKVLEEQE